jgi:glycosyltransferase involved in cell wall biosynthesis
MPHYLIRVCSFWNKKLMTPLAFKFGRYLLAAVDDEKEAISVLSASALKIKNIRHLSSFLKKISGKYLLAVTCGNVVKSDEQSMRRLLKIAGDTQAGIIYSDFIEQKKNDLIPHPLIDYQQGSIRDDFNLGHVLLFSMAAIKTILHKYDHLPLDGNAAFYDLRLKISIDHKILRVPEFLYTVTQPKAVAKTKGTNPTEDHFAYVAEENFARQKKLEKVATSYLKLTGTYLAARVLKAPLTSERFPVEASIVIPVLNRKKTISAAMKSALAQETNFDFNIIIVNNHSTDGTTSIIKKMASQNSKIVQLIPERRDLGIGGCWNEAIYAPLCGRYVVQLDSDDLYSSPQTLQKIVDILRKGNYAMVVGSYTIVNERLREIPPGLIDHREWTPANGHNNLLRVNGLGAPRAFSTTVIRKIGFPNVSYGEDYAVGLRIAREYKIGRIYKSLYLCRRWQDNTDAGLSVEKQNRNDFYKDELRTLEIKARQLINKNIRSLESRKIFAEYSGKDNMPLPALCEKLFDAQKKSWPTLTDACRDLTFVRVKEIICGSYNVHLQCNPKRAVSSGAAVDQESIRKRPCFLCAGNLPGGQQGILYRKDYMILCNPAPIFDQHFTIVTLQHQPQEISSSLSWLLQMTADLSPGYIIFYNGPDCGASAPDHLHFQMIPVSALAFLHTLKTLSPAKEISSVRVYKGDNLDRCVVILESKNREALLEQFAHFTKVTRKIINTNNEPQMNVLCTCENDTWRLVIFLRQKHRPDAYFAAGEKRIFVSPGAVDMAGVIITPLMTDFNRLDCDTIRGIYREVSLPAETMNTIMNEL